MADVNANIGVGIDTSDALSQLKALQRQISQFHSSIVKSSEAAALAQRNLQKNFVNSVNSIGAFSAELRTVRTSAETFTNSLEKNKFSMREYFRYSAGATKTFGKNFAAEFNTIEKVATERVKTLQTQYIKLGRDAQGAMQAIAIRPQVLDMKDLGTQTAIAAQKQALFNQLVKQGSTNLLNFGKNTQWAGRQLMVGFTLPLVTLGTVAGKTFMEMEAQVIKFKKVYGDLFTPDAERTKALEEIKQLASAFTQYGIAAQDTVGIAAEAAAAGFSGIDLQRQTEQSLRLSVLGQIDYQKSLETTISLQNSFRLSSADLAESIDFLNAVENQTVVSLDDITTAIPKVAPVIQSLGGDVKDLAFFMAAMKEGGINASEGANALKSGLASLINPSEKSAAFLASLGINLKGIVDANPNDVKGVVVGFAQALDKLEPTKRAQAIEQLFGKFQFARLSTLFDNVIRDGTQASRVLDLAGASIEELANMSEKELGVTAESAMNKFLKTVEDLKIALAPIGGVFLEVVTPFVEIISDILERFNALPEGIKKTIAATIAIVGGLGPVILMTFGLIANGVANSIKFIAMLRNGYLNLTGQTKVLGESTQYMTMEQLEAAAAAASLNQSHSNLIQTFNVEAGAVNQLKVAYEQAMAAGMKFAAMNPNMMKPGFAGPAAKFAAGGIVGGSGNKDTVAAMLTPGEFVVKKDVAQQMIPFLEALNAGKLPGFNKGGEVTAGGASYSVAGSGETVKKIQQFVTAIEQGSIKVSRADEVLAQTMKEVSESPKVYMKTFYQRLAVAADEIAEQSVANQVNKFYQKEMGFSGKAMSFSASGVGTIEKQMAAAGRSDELDRAKMRLEAESKLGLPGQLQIDRAHRIDVGRSGKAFSQTAFKQEAINPQTHSENAISNALAGENSVSGFFEMYSQTLKGLLDEGAIKQEEFNSIMGKAKNNLALSEGELLTQAQVLEKITASQNEFLTKNKALSNDIERAKAGAAVPGALMPGAGEVSADVAAKFTAELNEVKKGVVQGIKDSTRQASPSKEAYDAGANIGKGAVQGIESEIDDAKAASTKLADAMVAPVAQPARKPSQRSGSAFGNINAVQPPMAPTGPRRAAPAAVASGVAPVEQELARTKTLLGELKGSFANFRGNLSREMGWVKQEFLSVGASLKSMFGKASQETIEVVSKSAAIRAAENNQILVDGKKAGFNYVAAMAGRDGAVEAVVTKKNAEIISKVTANWNAGLREIPPIVPRELSKAQKEFLKIGQNLKNQMVDQEIDRANALKAAQVSAGAGVVPVGGAVGGKQAKAPKPGQAGFIGPLTERQSRPLDQKVGEFADKLAKGSLALAGLAGTATMLGGEIGMVAGMILQVTLAFSALASVTAALTKAKILEKTKGIATGIMGAAKAPGGLAKGGVMNNIINVITSVVGPIGKVGTALLRFLPVIGLVITAFAAFQFITGLIEEQKKKITGLGDTAFLTAEKMKKAGELLGFSPTGASDLSSGITQVEGVGAKELSQAETIRQGETFKDDFKTEIDAIRGGSMEAAQTALNSMMIQLISEGSSPEAAAALATAIATEAGKTDVDLSFAMKFDPKDPASLQSIAAAAKANAVQYGKAFDENAKTSPVTTELAAQAELLGGQMSSALLGLKTGFEQGTISATEFRSQVGEITGGLRELSPDAISRIIPTIAENFGLKDQLDGLDDMESQLVIIEALLAGVKVDPDVIKNMKELSKSSKPADKQKLVKLQKDLVAQTNAEITAIEGRTQAEAAGLEVDIAKAEFSEGMEGMQARIDQLNQEADAFNALVDQGWPAADAVKAVSDANFLAAFTAAGNAAAQQEVIDKYKEMQGLIASSPLAKFGGGGGGGAAQKSEFEEARDSLVKQRDEIRNNINAYNKLRNAGMGVEAAFRAAGDPQIAAAIAKTTPGTKKWEELIGLIRKTNIEAKKLEQLELSIQVQTDFGGFLSDMASKANEYYDILEANIERTYRDRIKAEEDAIKKAEKDISDLQNQVAGKERTIELTYDRPIADLQEEASDLSNDLTIIDKKSQAITEKYDKQKEALEQVKKVNQDIINQQKSQISLADALSQGDISAAAKLMQDMRGQAAAAATGSMDSALDAARQSELAGVTARPGGKTREQIEQRQYEIGQLIYDLEEKKEVVVREIRDLQDKIYAIEVGALKTAQDKLAALEAQKQKEIDIIDAQRQKWDDAATAQGLAEIAAGKYKDVVEIAKGFVGDIVKNWKSIKDRTVKLFIQEVRVPAGASVPTGSGGGSGGRGTDPKPDPKNLTGANPNAAAAAAALRQLQSGGSASLTNAQRGLLGMAPKPSGGGGNVQVRKFGGLIRKFANGGMVPGTGMGDVVPAMLTPGEFVVNKASTKQFMPMLKAMNESKFPVAIREMMRPGPMLPPNVNFNVRGSSGSVKPIGPSFNKNWKNMSAPSTMPMPSRPNQTIVSTNPTSLMSTETDNSVYNYNLSINVDGGSNINADALASKVIMKIKQMDAQRVRSKVIS